jgi:hypothetical protein
VAPGTFDSKDTALVHRTYDRMKRRLSNKKLLQFSTATLIWIVLASSLAYSLDLECFLDNDACRQVCLESSEDLCGEPLHLGPPSYLPTPIFQFVRALTASSTLVVFEEAPELIPGRRNNLPVGLRAPPFLV